LYGKLFINKQKIGQEEEKGSTPT